jgi:hypothetical protein
MTGTFFPNDPEGAFQAIHMPDFGISWAGPNPFGEGFCFGSEAGHLVLTDTKGQPRSLLGRASASGEAVNGVAYSRGWLAVTTRKDLNFIPPLSVEPSHLDAVVIYGGAPDVIAAPSGHFLIPLGRTGIMFAKPGMTEKDPVTISNAEKHGMNFCRVLAFNGDEEGDLIVAAGRRGGVGFTRFKEGMRGHLLNTVKFDMLDIVDICSIATAEHPRAVAAAGRDGSLVLFRDMVTDKKPLTFKFRRITGIVYRILGARGDLYLLTSNGLFAIFKLAERFLAGLSLRQITTDVLRLPIEAADANLVDQKWVLATGVDDLFRFDITKIPKSPGEGNDLAWEEPSAPDELELSVQWEESGFEQMVPT